MQDEPAVYDFAWDAESEEPQGVWQGSKCVEAMVLIGEADSAAFDCYLLASQIKLEPGDIVGTQEGKELRGQAAARHVQALAALELDDLVVD